MTDHHYSHEHYFYWLAFLIALALRLFQLGLAPLSETEAGWALQALSLARGQTVTLGAQPAYLVLTSQLFSLMDATNFLARLCPALAGSLLVWLPFCFRRWMGDEGWLHRAGLVLAFGLAIDPGLVSLSRQVGSQVPAVAFTLLALAAIVNRRMVWAGIFVALALLSGPAFLQGLLILVISWGLFRLAGRRKAAEPSDADEPELQPAPPSRLNLFRNAVPAFILTLLFAGVLFFRLPQGLGAFADTLPAYLRSWITPSGIPVLRLPASLLIYQPLVIIFAVSASTHLWFRRQDDQPVRPVLLGLGLWAIIAILLPLLTVGRQVGDLAWALIPLWVLASLEIGCLLQGGGEVTTFIVAGCLAALLFVLAVVGWINTLDIGRYQSNITLYWAMNIGAFLLGLIAVLLVAAGWSVDAARFGVAGAVCIVLGLQLISNTVGMSIVRLNNAQELWPTPPTTGQADLLLTTLTDLSSWNTGLRDQLEIVVLDSSPSLQWALRNFPDARFESTLATGDTPPVVITLKGTEEPVLAQQYRGEDFVWLLSPAWPGALPPDFVNWLAFRNAPLNQSQLILWARADIFPGAAAGPAGRPVP